MSLPTRQARAAVAAATVLLALTACLDARPAVPADDKNDLRYGAAPAAHPDVTLHRDVVIVSGGSSVVRSVTDGGLTWRIDPRAGNADRLAPGKVMFLTGRGVGRVLDARRDGRDLAVTIGPVGITDVIQDGEFRSAQPISLADASAYQFDDTFWAHPSPEAPRSEPTATATVNSAPATTVNALTLTGTRPATAAAPLTASAAARADKLEAEALCCADGVGARFSYRDSGLSLSGSIAFVMKRPSATFHLVIDGSTVTVAELRIHGAGGVRVQVDATTTTGQNVHPVAFVPVTFSVPIESILGIPFSATVRQSIGIRTGFSAGHTTIKASGEYSLGGTMGFGYADGRFGPRWPGGLQVKRSLVDSVDGRSVGANALLIDYDVKFFVGLGAVVFSAGLYAGLTTTVGITRGSSIGFGGLQGLAAGEGCNRADLTINARYGIGYTIPALVAKVINFFLRVFNAKPIAAEGGIPDPPPVVNLVNKHWVTDRPVCQH
ncbi:hypothetical protein O7634_23450 [Micromonospora sp. WMMD1120]|uniref:hypothetical protein n=1 Tax=Micromonospora sp. WMMD1120 TaxID=3016106 RepID=UPI002416F836|nr:hypothetical protein [Micromonospora sp. WMMD1120]MDG4809717.1 hypothetical protein [Micromonospora sp. WMMD1120]